MQTPSYKRCPQCGQPAVLTVPDCQRCGHAFETVYTQPIPPLASPWQPPVSHDWRLAQLQELEREYRTLTHIGCALLFFLLPAGGLGMLLAFFVWQRQQDIRRRVAQLGVPPDAWEEPLKTWAVHTMLYYLAVLAVILLVCFMLVRLIGR